MTRSSSAASAAFVAFAASLVPPACITGGGRARPLYPGDSRPPDEVARLFGPIGSVDGQDVSRLGKSFALLPGCHVVRPVSKVAEVDRTAPNAYVARVPSDVTYAFRMQAGHTYEIEVRPADNTGYTSVDAVVRAWDRDAKGGARAVPPIASTTEIDACQVSKPQP
jgi:hypothetical protein